MAFTTLQALEKRDTNIGGLRMLNVLRLAAGLPLFPADTFANVFGRPYRDLWKWFQARATKETQLALTEVTFTDAFRAARQDGASGVWGLLADAPGVLVPLGKMPDTWDRIRAVEALFT